MDNRENRLKVYGRENRLTPERLQELYKQEKIEQRQANQSGTAQAQAEPTGINVRQTHALETRDIETQTHNIETNDIATQTDHQPNWTERLASCLRSCIEVGGRT